MVRALTGKIGGRRFARGAIQMFDTGARVAVLVRQKGRLVVADLIDVRFGKPGEGGATPAAAKGSAVRDALKSRGWQSGRMSLVLPKNVVTMRLVTLPSDDDNELVDMARFEAQKHIPFNVDRHVISHAVLRKEGVEGSQTLIVAVDRAALEEPLAVCHAAGIDLTEARVSSLALVEALLLAPPGGWETATFGLVDIGWSTVDITIVSDGIVRFTRSGSMGVQRIAPVLEEMLGGHTVLTSEQLRSLDALDPSAFSERRARPTQRRARPATFVVDDFAEDEAGPGGIEASGPRIALEAAEESAPAKASGPARDVELWLNRIVQEIERTYTFAAREFECPRLETVYLAGAGSRIYNIDAYLQKRLHCPVMPIAAPETIDFAKATDRDLRAEWGEYAVPIGAATGASLPALNLLPPEYTRRQESRRRRKSLVVTGALFVVLLAVGGGYGWGWFSDLRSQLDFYRSNNEAMAPLYEQLREDENRLRILEDILGDPLSALTVLEKISAIDLITQNPPKVTLLEYLYEKGRGVTLSGHALSYADLTSFTQELQQTGCFVDVLQKERSPTSIGRGRPDVIKYTINCDFKLDQSE